MAKYNVPTSFTAGERIYLLQDCITPKQLKEYLQCLELLQSYEEGIIMGRKS